MDHHFDRHIQARTNRDRRIYGIQAKSLQATVVVVIVW